MPGREVDGPQSPPIYYVVAELDFRLQAPGWLMMTRDIRARRRERGQSTTEFLLMMPLLMAMFFFIIEMSLYFSSVHYTNYASYAAARGHAVGEDPDQITAMLLTGSIYTHNGGNYTVEYVDNNNSSSNQQTAKGVRVTVREWYPSLPFLQGILPSRNGGLRYSTSNYLGPPECTYEDLNSGNRKYYDNNVSSCL